MFGQIYQTHFFTPLGSQDGDLLLFFALCLSWLTYIGNYMNSIRHKLKKREAELSVSKSNLREAVLEIRQNAEILNDSSLELSDLTEHMSNGAGEM